MVRKELRRRPELESLETMVLLSGISAVDHAGGEAMLAREPVADASIVLVGTAKGTYKTSSSFLSTFNEKGTISPLGKVKIKGSIQYGILHPTGTVTVSSATKKHGKITASLTTAGPDDPVFYTITSSSGIFAGDTGSGESLETLTIAKGKGPVHGKVTVMFVD